MPAASRTLEMIASSNAGRARKRKKADPAAKAARIAAYEARNKAIKALQQAAGPNLAAAALAKKAKIEAQRVAERAAEEAKALEFVDSILNGPHGPQARRFIGKGLEGSPCRIALVLRNWKATQGF